jgi:hypothetical protein
VTRSEKGCFRGLDGAGSPLDSCTGRGLRRRKLGGWSGGQTLLQMGGANRAAFSLRHASTLCTAWAAALVSASDAAAVVSVAAADAGRHTEQRAPARPAAERETTAAPSIALGWVAGGARDDRGAALLPQLGLPAGAPVPCLLAPTAGCGLLAAGRAGCPPRGVHRRAASAVPNGVGCLWLVGVGCVGVGWLRCMLLAVAVAVAICATVLLVARVRY